jgi:hypothetical protein
VLLLAHYLLDTMLAVVAKRLGRVLEQPRLAGALRRGHGGWEIDQPLGVDDETAHHLEGRGAVALRDGHTPHQLGLDDVLAQHILEIQQLVLALLC